MLADNGLPACSGALDPDIQLSSTARLELMGFISQELPRWRDHPERRPESSETKLTDQLCSHLNSAARRSEAWSNIQFRTEVPDERRGGRTVDLAPKPLGVILILEGRRCSEFDMLFPIECKRLPTPRDSGRDEREYVFTSPNRTGGIQRFKAGLHGAAHCFGGMIGYVQEETSTFWLARVNGWIRELSEGATPTWRESDELQQVALYEELGLAVLQSQHSREGGLADCDLRHLWITMQ